MKIDNFIREKSLKEINDKIKEYLESYSFSTLDIILSDREILSLDVEDLYNKIVIEKRGGYCFEHNKLFGAFLESIHVIPNKQLCRVVYGKEIDAPRTHRVNIITIDGLEYLVDVGFGTHTPSALIPLNGEEVKCSNGSIYRINSIGREEYSLDVLRESGFFSFYTFDMGTYTEADFSHSSYYSNTHPNSKHANNLVMSINRGNETTTILNKKLILFRGSEREEIDIDDAEQLRDILFDSFFLNLSLIDSEKLYEKLNE